jgi:hypothetical protein
MSKDLIVGMHKRMVQLEKQAHTHTQSSEPLLLCAMQQSARNARQNDSIKRAIDEYDEALEAYIPGEACFDYRDRHCFA